MKLGVCGHFGGKGVFLDGQTVKTKTVHKALCRHYGEENIKIVDTYNIKKRFLPVFFGTLKLFLNCDACIMLPAHNGIKIFSPLFTVLKTIFRKKIYYSVIGGWLAKFISDKPSLEKRLKRFDAIFVETTTMKRALEARGFSNIVVIANFKELEIVSADDMNTEFFEPYKLCTFSRVMKEKGMEEAIAAIKAVNETMGRTVYTLDIYGPVDSSQTQWFEGLRSRFPDCVRYLGCVPFDESVSVLKGYFALMFPTLFYTEGVPGTIVDAYAAGVPVISSRWESFSDIVDEGKSGVGYEFDNNEDLIRTLKQIADYPKIITDMKVYCTQKAEIYLPGNAIVPMIERIG